MVKKEVSVIIPSHNEEKYLGKCLKSLKKQTHPPLEIIVVDNNSTDGTVKVARNYNVRILKCNEQGIASARNFGAEHSRGEILSFIDADGIVNKKWIEKLNKHYSKNNDLDAVCGTNIFDSKNLPRFLFYNIYNVIVFSGLYLGNKIGKYLVAGNNMAINRDLFFEVGGFPKYVAEDIKLSHNLRNHKPLNIKFDPRMTIMYSTRRFDKRGFLSTLKFWISASFFKNIGEGIYKEDY